MKAEEAARSSAFGGLVHVPPSESESESAPPEVPS
jgi:hypothetical protein